MPIPLMPRHNSGDIFDAYLRGQIWQMALELVSIAFSIQRVNNSIYLSLPTSTEPRPQINGRDTYGFAIACLVLRMEARKDEVLSELSRLFERGFGGNSPLDDMLSRWDYRADEDAAKTFLVDVWLSIDGHMPPALN